MKTKILIPIILGFLCVGCTTPSDKSQPAVPSNKTVNVVFQNPEKFTDVKNSTMDSDKDRDYILEQIKEHITERAPRYMAEGQVLDITISDIDMAGDFEPWRGPRVQDVRIVKDIYPPRVDLAFKLTGAGGVVVSEGSRHLSDLSFMMTMTPIPTSDSLRYEKKLIDDWLSTEFASLNKK